MKCTHCKNELIKGQYLESKRIPNDQVLDKRYVACNCGNVMIGIYNNGELQSICQTKTGSNAETLKQMQEAYSLFDEKPIDMSLEKKDYSYDEDEDDYNYDYENEDDCYDDEDEEENTNDYYIINRDKVEIIGAIDKDTVKQCLSQLNDEDLHNIIIIKGQEVSIKSKTIYTI